MSSTTSSGIAAPSTGCAAQLYDIPNKDNTCAMPYKANHTEILQACCGDAKIVSYRDNCGIYCVAIDQTIGDLTKCLYKNGAANADVFCSGSKKTTKTKDADVPATAQASAIDADSKTKSKDDDENKSTATGSETATGTSSSSTGSSTGNAAAGFAPKSSINTVGLAIGALLFSSFAAGAFQL
ncbi:hypothetical protein F53441_6640 [Fusarium austroafricanum]|uniref:Uncharacterized protein n=1 Tax=Fusarium austroafricanum TaxID=2364996 RepID=A0A8H4KI40_9HYPO|nr:hypothetical protein F53441_6640 [Fusarium austroafricanum]